jgi:pimeloyl-ACP methyl ester carboxylesterase
MLNHRAQIEHMRRGLTFVLKLAAAGALIIVLALGMFRLAAYNREASEAASLVPANGSFIETSYGKIHYSTWGDTTGQPVLLTHGMAAWGGLWQETAEALAAQGYRVIAVDQPPFGFSDRDNDDFSRIAEARRVSEVVEKLGLSNVLLVGHSYGGGVALESVLQTPQLYKAVVLVCPVTGLLGPQPPPVKNLPFVLRSRIVTELLVSATITNPWLTAMLAKQFMHKKERLTDAHVATLQRPMSRTGNTEAMAKWLQTFLAGDAGALSATQVEASKIAIPLALIWGAEDTVVTVAEGREIAVVLRTQDLTVIPDIGHMPQLEDPAAFNAALSEALGRLR